MKALFVVLDKHLQPFVVLAKSEEEALAAAQTSPAFVQATDPEDLSCFGVRRVQVQHDPTDLNNDPLEEEQDLVDEQGNRLALCWVR